MAQADKTPNHEEFFINTITGQVPPRCGSEMVDIRGQVKLKFGMGEFNGQRYFMPVQRDLAKGIGNKNCPNSGGCEVGVGKSSGRKYKADKTISVNDVGNFIDQPNKIPGVFGVGSCKIKLFVTGNPNPAGQAESCPECKFRSFSLEYTLTYSFNKNGKVTPESFEVLNQKTPDIRCRD